jgi:hypothetical protein
MMAVNGQGQWAGFLTRIHWSCCRWCSRLGHQVQVRCRCPVLTDRPRSPWSTGLHTPHLTTFHHQHVSYVVRQLHQHMQAAAAAQVYRVPAQFSAVVASFLLQGTRRTVMAPSQLTFPSGYLCLPRMPQIRSAAHRHRWCNHQQGHRGGRQSCWGRTPCSSGYCSSRTPVPRLHARQAFKTHGMHESPRQRHGGAWMHCGS